MLEQELRELEVKRDHLQQSIKFQKSNMSQQQLISSTELDSAHCWIKRCSMFKWLLENRDVFESATVEEMRGFFGK